MQPLTIKQRSASTAAWLHCLAPGLGLYYLELRDQARLWLLLVMLPWFLWLLLPAQRLLPMLIVAALVSLLFLLAGMLLSWRRANAMGPVVQSPEQRWYGYGLFWLSFIFLCLLWLALLVAKLGVIPYQVSDNSMAGTIKKHDWVLLDRRPRQSSPIQRDDVVLFNHPDSGQPVLQRVVGLPGERITVHGGGLFINGRWQSEPYLDDMRNQKNIPEGVVETTVPVDRVFVLADNRDASRDSRYWGALPQAQIDGRVVYRWQQPLFSWQELLTGMTGLSLSQ